MAVFCLSQQFTCGFWRFACDMEKLGQHIHACTLLSCFTTGNAIIWTPINSRMDESYMYHAAWRLATAIAPAFVLLASPTLHVAHNHCGSQCTKPSWRICYLLRLCYLQNMEKRQTTTHAHVTLRTPRAMCHNAPSPWPKTGLTCSTPADQSKHVCTTPDTSPLLSNAAAAAALT